MQIERPRPQVLLVSLHPLEMAALVTAARWVVDGRHGEPPPAAIEQLRAVLASYDVQAAKVGPTPAIQAAEVDRAR